MAIEIVDFPINSMVIFHSYVTNKLLEAKCWSNLTWRLGAVRGLVARNDGATNGATGAVVTVSRGSVRLVSSGGAGGATTGTTGAGKERRVEVRDGKIYGTQICQLVGGWWLTYIWENKECS